MAFTKPTELVVASDRGQMAVFELKRQKFVSRFRTRHKDVNAVRYLAASKEIVLAHEDGFDVWDLTSKERKQAWSAPGVLFVEREVGVGTGRYFVGITSVGNEGMLWVIDVDQEVVLHSEEIDAGLSAVSVSPDDQLFALGLMSGEISVFDLKTAKLLTTLRGHDRKDIVTDLSFSSNGRTLLSASSDTTALVWRLPFAKGSSGQ